MDFRKLALSIIGRKEVPCPRCHGTGENDRGDWCWPCAGTGTQTILKKEEPQR